MENVEFQFLVLHRVSGLIDHRRLYAVFMGRLKPYMFKSTLSFGGSP